MALLPSDAITVSDVEGSMDAPVESRCIKTRKYSEPEVRISVPVASSRTVVRPAVLLPPELGPIDHSPRAVIPASSKPAGKFNPYPHTCG